MASSESGPEFKIAILVLGPGFSQVLHYIIGSGIVLGTTLFGEYFTAITFSFPF